MPAANIEEVIANKPLTFKIKTSGGSWKCQLHTNRAAYERAMATEVTATIPGTPAPGIARTDSGLSTTSTSSTASSSST